MLHIEYIFLETFSYYLHIMSYHLVYGFSFYYSLKELLLTLCSIIKYIFYLHTYIMFRLLYLFTVDGHSEFKFMISLTLPAWCLSLKDVAYWINFFYIHFPIITISGCKQFRRMCSTFCLMLQCVHSHDGVPLYHVTVPFVICVKA